MSRVLAMTFLLLAAGAAQAQFRLPSLDVGRMVDSVKNVGKARMQRYVNNVGRWIASQSERPDLPWQFGVLDAPQLNAFAVPGGTIFITRGLVQRMRSEAELAGVLAHEIAHV